jgi:transcriptional regulator with XRE-family HTH domain
MARTIDATTSTAVDAGANTFGGRLRAERERLGIGVRELSRRLDVSASMISQIERGRVMPSVNTLYSITSALGVSLDDLFAPEAGDAAHASHAAGGRGRHVAAAQHASDLVVRRAESKKLELSSGVLWELLTAEQHAGVDFLRTTYAPGSESTAADALMRHSGHEYGTVTDGRLAVTVGFETFSLEAGDSIAFDSSTPHRLFNESDAPATAIWVVVGRRGDPRGDLA